MEVKLRPWLTPNYVKLELPPAKREDGFAATEGIHICNLSAEDLSAQCDRFRADVFDKAGKVDPREKEDQS